MCRSRSCSGQVCVPARRPGDGAGGLFIFRGWEGSCLRLSMQRAGEGRIYEQSFQMCAVPSGFSRWGVLKRLAGRSLPAGRDAPASTSGKLSDRGGDGSSHLNFLVEKPDFFKEHFHISRQVQNSSVGF